MKLVIKGIFFKSTRLVFNQVCTMRLLSNRCQFSTGLSRLSSLLFPATESSFDQNAKKQSLFTYQLYVTQFCSMLFRYNCRAPSVLNSNLLIQGYHLTFFFCFSSQLVVRWLISVAFHLQPLQYTVLSLRYLSSLHASWKQFDGVIRSGRVVVHRQR